MLIEDVRAVKREQFQRNNRFIEPSNDLIEQYREQNEDLNTRIDALRIKVEELEKEIEAKKAEEDLPVKKEGIFSKLFSAFRSISFFQNKQENEKNLEEEKIEIETQIEQLVLEKRKVREALDAEKIRQNKLKDRKEQYEQELSKIDNAQTLKSLGVKNLFYALKILKKAITLTEDDKAFSENLKNDSSLENEDNIYLISGIKEIRKSGIIELFGHQHIMALRKKLGFFSDNEDRSFSINSENNVSNTDRYAIMIPLSKVPNESVEALTTDGKIILNSDFILPQNSIFLVPVSERARIIEANSQNDSTRRAVIIGYRGENVKGYASALLKTLGYPEEKSIPFLNKKGRFIEWKQKNISYFSKSAANDFIEICDAIFSRDNIRSLETLDNYLDRVEISGKYQNFKDLSSDAFSFRNSSARILAYEYIRDNFIARGYTISENADEIMKLIIQGKLEDAKEKYQQLDLKFDTKQTFLRNITDYEETLLSDRDLIIKTFMQMMLTENDFLKYKVKEEYQLEFYDGDEFPDEELEKSKSNRKKINLEKNIKPKIVKEKIDYRLYDDNHEALFNSLYDRIRTICTSPKNTIHINYALKEAMELFNIAKKDWRIVYENSRTTGNIFYKGMNIPIRPKLPENFEGSYRRKGENRIVTAARLLHLQNRLAHTYDEQLTETIKTVFGIANKNDGIEVEDTRSFKNLKNQIEMLTLTDRNSKNSMQISRYSAQRNCIYDILDVDFGIKMEEEQFNKIESISRQLVDFRNKSFENKDALIEFVSKNMKNENEKKPGTYSYGLKSNETGTFLIMDIPEYEQIITHIIDKNVLENIMNYVEEYQLDLVLREGKSSMLVSGVSEEFQDEISGIPENELISNLQEKLSNEDLHKTLVRMGYSGKKLEEALKPKNNGSER